jgi:hypothetical protein
MMMVEPSWDDMKKGACVRVCATQNPYQRLQASLRIHSFSFCANPPNPSPLMIS